MDPLTRRAGSRRRTMALAAAMVGCVALSSPTATAASVSDAVADEPPSLLALYDFSESAGSVLRDGSAHANDGVVVGGEAWRGGFMQFTGANHVTLPNGLLAGKSAATVVIETSPEALTGAKFLWNFGGSGNAATGQFFIQPVVPRVAISPSNWSGEQTVTSSKALVEGQWQSVAATIQRNEGGATSTLRMFIDGVMVAEKTDSSVHLDALLTHTMNFIGKSAYSGDSLYRGKVSTFRVYEEALPAAVLADIAAADAADAAAETVAAVDLAAVNLQDLDEVESALVLPAAGGVSWSSQPEGIIGPDGAVAQPAQDTVVTLTATATVRGVAATKTFDVTVLQAPTAAEQASRAAAAILLPSVLEQGYVLPATVRDLPVVWSHSSGAGDVVDGEITSAPAVGLQAATLEAVVGAGEDAASATFEVRIAEAGAQSIAAYTTSRNTRGGDDPEVTRTTHLALSADGTNFTALNSGTGIVFPKVTGMTEQANGIKRYLAEPHVFRLRDDEGFGLIARRVGVAGTPAAGDTAGVLVFTSTDLVQWTEHELLTVPGQGVSGRVSAEWDARTSAYRVVWTDAAGAVFAGSTDDFDELTFLGAGAHPAGRAGSINVAHAHTASIIPLTTDEAKNTADLLGRVRNVGLQEPADVTVYAGGELILPEKVTAEYSDGGTHDFRVTWDSSNVDTSTPGDYEVTGALQSTDTVFPLLPRRADPHMLRYTLANGEKTWLYIATDDDGLDEFFIRQADTIAGIATAPDNRILGIGLSGTAPVGAQLWAPEFHEVGGDLYILFAANANNVNAWNGVQSYTMRLTPGGNPLVRADWQAPQRVVDAQGQPLTQYGTGITLDMTTFEDAGTQYAMWSERRVPAGGIGPAVLKIAKVIPSTTGAWRLDGDRSTVQFPDRGWSANTTEVAEGPFVIQRDGKVMITFSGSNVDWTYAVGLMTADSGADLLDPAAWATRTYPIWSYEGVNTNNWGPGHNSYTYDDDGNLINIFHAKLTQNGTRDSGARMVYFRQDDSPILDMTDAEWLTAENRTVVMTVTVEGSASAFAFDAQVRCVAGKAVLVVTLDPGSAGAADVAVSSAYGQKQVNELDRVKSVTLNTRLAEVPAGELSAAVVASGGTTTHTASYPARSCG